MNKELCAIRQTLADMAEKEATKLYRLARNLQKRGASVSLLAEVRSEAHQLHMCAYPERLVAWDAPYKFKYAFKC